MPRKLLLLLEEQLHISTEQVTRQSGADNGFVLRSHEVTIPRPNRSQSAPAGGDLYEPGGGSYEPGGWSVETRGVVPRDHLQEPIPRTNTKNLEQEPEDLGRTAVAVAPPIDRSKGLQASREAFTLYQSVQRSLGGVLSDQASKDATKQAIAGVSDEQVERASALALHNAFSRYWVYGRPASHCAGQAIHAAVQDKLAELTGGADCSPDAGELPVWNETQWIDLEMKQPLLTTIQAALSEAPAALDKEEHEGLWNWDLKPSEGLVEASEGIAGEGRAASFVNSIASAVTAKPGKQSSPEPYTDGGRVEEARVNDLRANAKRQAALLDLTGSANRYGLPA